MLRIIQNSRPAGAKSYYKSADYYTEKQELTGVWRGKGAALLGLTGEVTEADWNALCDNKHPETGKSLTLRQKKNRRVGYDFNFHVPKSVSLLYGLTQDERILKAFRDSVDETMQEIEAQMQARVRTDGRNDNRTTGNAVWGEYVHTTSRPVDGVPDPQLHAHCFVMNATFDADEQRWKAGEFARIKGTASLYEAKFHARLARRMEELGLAVERNRKSWEIAGLSRDLLERFSRRTAEIEAKARELGITDPVEKGELGARTRSKKNKQLSIAELRKTWSERLSPEESSALAAVSARIGGPAIAEDKEQARETVERAVRHVFERKSVVTERELTTTALKGAFGAASVESVLQQLAQQPLLRAERGGEVMVTTREVLGEERRLVAIAREGRGTCAQLAPGEHAWKRTWLNRGQVAAVLHVLGSRDSIIMVRGAAGVGKTSALQEMAEAIEASGKKVFAFAPSAEASRGELRKQGFATADTVARLLVDDRMQEQTRGQVILIDEAGLLSVPMMKEVCELAGRLDARLILTGDERQHASVERGSPLRLLEQEAGIRPAEINAIQRQEKKEYRSIVQDLSEGRVKDAFGKLDRLGWIRELDASERYKALAGDYLATVSGGKTALVVSPTHREGDLITQTIRDQLKKDGRLSGEEHSIPVLASAGLTEAQRSDPVNYADGDVIVFHQNAKGYKKGSRVAVTKDEVPLTQARHFDVFRQARVRLASGDRIRVTRNGKTLDGKHSLNNGDLFTVAGFDKADNLVLENGWTVAKDYGHLSYGYVITSHSSQSKTVQRVIIGQSWDSMPASSQAQFYVSASRGKESAMIYTDNKEELLHGVSRQEERLSAIELMRERALMNHRQQDVERGADSKANREPELAHG